MSQDDRTGGGDDRLRALLRDVYAPPSDPAYWSGLEARVLARVRLGAPERAVEWWQLLGAWARAGAVAAALTALAAAAALVQTRAVEARVAYEAVVETTPALPLTAVARSATTPSDGREATLRYVISH
jgi:hypothetical protein